MTTAFLNGLWEGILISLLLFGPAFFKLMNVSMQEGVFKGAWLAFGVLISDLIVVLLLIYGMSDLLSNPVFRKMYTLIAGIALVIIGLKTMSNKYKAFLTSFKSRSKGGKNFFSGLILNILNPFTLILWFNLVSIINLKYDAQIDFRSKLLFNLTGILVSLFVVDMLKVYFAHFMGKNISNKKFYIVNRYFGAVFIIIGVVFVSQFFWSFAGN